MSRPVADTARTRGTRGGSSASRACPAGVLVRRRILARRARRRGRVVSRKNSVVGGAQSRIDARGHARMRARRHHVCVDRRAHISARPGDTAHVVRPAVGDSLVSRGIRLGVMASRHRRIFRSIARAHDRVVSVRHAPRCRGTSSHRHLARRRRAFIGSLAVRRGVAGVAAASAPRDRRWRTTRGSVCGQ